MELSDPPNNLKKIQRSSVVEVLSNQKNGIPEQIF